MVSIRVSFYSMLNIEMLAKLITYISMHNVHFVSGQITLHMPINYAKTEATPFRLWMHKLIDDFHLERSKRQ